MTRFQRFLWNAFLLTAASLGMRAVGVLFNMYLTGKLGAAGLGRFSLIMSVYNLAVTVASSGIHLAVTRVVAEEAGSGRRHGVRRAMQTGFGYSLFFGVLSGILLYVCSAPIGILWLRDAETIPSLRLLALSLPFLALSTVLNGYFIAMRQAAKGAAVNTLGQMVKIGVTVFCLRMFLPRGTAWSCIALVCGTVASEAISFLLSMLFYLPARNRDCALAKTVQSGPAAQAERGVSIYLLRIAVPIALTTYIRSGLLTLEHLLIPMGLQKSGIAAEAALASYGTVHGMVMPVILFPAAFLAAFSGLIIPEIAEYRSKDAHTTVLRTAGRVIRVTLLFSILVSGAMLCFSRELGLVLYQSEEAGKYIRILAALIPVMYLDTMVDAMLKGLDQQVASMRYNIADAAFCAAAAYLLLPKFGIGGYLFLLYASEIFNFSLSLNRLLQVTHLPFSIGKWVLLPVFSIIGAAGISTVSFRWLGQLVTFQFPAVTLTVHILCTMMLYCVLLLLTGGVKESELSRVWQMICGKKQISS